MAHLRDCSRGTSRSAYTMDPHFEERLEPQTPPRLRTAISGGSGGSGWLGTGSTTNISNGPPFELAVLAGGFASAAVDVAIFRAHSSLASLQACDALCVHVQPSPFMPRHNERMCASLSGSKHSRCLVIDSICAVATTARIPGETCCIVVAFFLLRFAFARTFVCMLRRS